MSFFQSEATRRSKSGLRVIMMQEFCITYNFYMRGVDGTVSAIVGQGKRKVSKNFISSSELKNICSVFSNDQADKNDLEKSGNLLMAIFYGDFMI